MRIRRFYSVIIGTELLNGRRSDSHFSFLNAELIRRGWEHNGNFIISDDPIFMAETLALLREKDNSVIFVFGGLGATPDDYTRHVASKVFRNGNMAINVDVKQILESRFGDKTYPHRIQMAYWPTNATMIPNPINRIPGFALDGRYFFLPGFPEMAHPMITWVLDRYYPNGQTKYRKTVTIQTNEESLIAFMQSIPKTVELSSLPASNAQGSCVTLSLSSYANDEVQRWFQKIMILIQDRQWEYAMEETCDS
jgi:molybdopterin-biosynthesis enzyme MoeA-like protein